MPVIKHLDQTLGGGVTGVKGENESSYRTGNVNLTPANLGALGESNVAPVEATTTASQAYSVDDLLIYSGQLYKVTDAIAQGGTIVTSGAGANVTATTIEENLGGGGSGGGHVIQNSDGTAMPQRSVLKFSDFMVRDDPTNGITVVSNKKEIKIYGFHQDFTNSDPDTNITYISGVQNENYSPMMTNSALGTPTAGDWGTFLTDVLCNKPGMVKTDGTLDYWLDPEDYTKKEDGTASDISNSSYSGIGAFSWISKMYKKEVYASDGGSRDVYFAFGGCPDDSYELVGFTDWNDNIVEGIWFPMMYGDINTGKIYSSYTYPTGDNRKTVANCYQTIKSLSSRMTFFGGAILCIMYDLLYMLFKSSRFWHFSGYTARSNITTGNHLVSGGINGFIGNDGSSSTKAFHSILLMGDNPAYDPYIFARGNALYCNKKYQYDSSGSGYDSTGITVANTNGWQNINRLQKIDGYGSVFKQSYGGSDSTYLCASHYMNQSYHDYTTRVILEKTTPDNKMAFGMYWDLSADKFNALQEIVLPPVGYSPV